MVTMGQSEPEDVG